LIVTFAVVTERTWRCTFWQQQWCGQTLYRVWM